MLRADSRGRYTIRQPDQWGLFLESAERDILDNYAVCLKNVRDELLRIYNKYSVGGILTKAEMSKYNRLNSLFKVIAKEIKDMTGKNRRLVNELMGETYNDVFYRTMFEFDRYAKYELNFGLVDKRTIEALITNPLKEKAEKDAPIDLLRKIKYELSQGFLKGDSFINISKKIQTVYGQALYRSVRIARTEGMRACSQGQLAAVDEAEDLGIQGDKMWIATHDMRTRDSHGYMDGKKADEKGIFHLRGGITCKAPHLTGVAGEDINCRCRFIYVVEGYEPRVRRVKGDGIVSYQNYEEWYKEKVA
jgi:hypothetical protein